MYFQVVVGRQAYILQLKNESVSQTLVCIFKLLLVDRHTFYN